MNLLLCCSSVVPEKDVLKLHSGQYEILYFTSIVKCVQNLEFDSRIIYDRLKMKVLKPSALAQGEGELNVELAMVSASCQSDDGLLLL